MVDTVHHPNEAEAIPELSITLRGRGYPLTCRRVMPLPDIPPPAEWPTAGLEKRIVTMLSFPGRHPESFRGSTEIVRAFCNDMVLLESMAEQWRVFLRRLRKSNIKAVFADNIPKRQQQQAIDEALQVMGHESKVMVDDAGVLNGDLVEQSPVHVFQTLQATLKRAVNIFTGVMECDLDALADLRVVGLLEWCGEGTCRFHYYEHKLTSVVDHQATDRQHVQMTRRGKTGVGVEVFEELAGRHVHRVTRRTELLIEAKSCSANDPHLVLPKFVRDTIQHCPAWLRPELEVVEGEKVREEWVELMRIEHQWQQRECKQRIQPHFDPALTLFGHFVLMGWDEKAHQREIRDRIRRSSEQLQRSPAPIVSEHPHEHLTPMIAWIVAVVFGMLVLVATGGRFAVIPAILLPLACVPMTYRYLTNGDSVFRLNNLETKPFMNCLSVMFTVMAMGLLLGAWTAGRPAFCLLGLIAFTGGVYFRFQTGTGGAA